MAGRPPKPTALKLLHGNPGHRPLNNQEPKPAVGAQPPAWIAAQPILLTEWHRHAPRLTKLGLLTEIDDTALAVMCLLEVQLRTVVKDTMGAGDVTNLAKELRMLWSRFGMTPADRARVKVEKPQEGGKMGRFIGDA